jgi:hypothetical protein
MYIFIFLYLISWHSRNALGTEEPICLNRQFFPFTLLQQYSTEDSMLLVTNNVVGRSFEASCCEKHHVSMAGFDSRIKIKSQELELEGGGKGVVSTEQLPQLGFNIIFSSWVSSPICIYIYIYIYIWAFCGLFFGFFISPIQKTRPILFIGMRCFAHRRPVVGSFSSHSKQKKWSDRLGPLVSKRPKLSKIQKKKKKKKYIRQKMKMALPN